MGIEEGDKPQFAHDDYRTDLKVWENGFDRQRSFLESNVEFQGEGSAVAGKA